MIAENNDAICRYVIKVRQGMRKDRVFAQKGEGEEDGTTVRREILDGVKGSWVNRLDCDLLTVNSRGV